MARLPRCLVIGLVGCTLTAMGHPATSTSTAASPVHTQQAAYSPPRPLTPEPVRLDPRCERGRVLCADKTTRTLRWVVDGEIRMTLAARFGGPDHRTREGTFEVYDKLRHHVSSLYGTPMPFAMFFSGGQAVHFSKPFAVHGYGRGSHGCINLRNYRATAKLFNRVDEGDRVVVYRSGQPRQTSLHHAR
jgi:hypothetical protein